MNSQIIIEGIGYLGSLLVVVSMLMTSVKKLRIVNSIGSIIFCGYAFIIKSYPTALMNLCLVGINIYNLAKLIKKEQEYQVIECYKDESIVRDIIRTYSQDIEKYFPTFKNDNTRKLSFLICSDSRPIGLLIGTMSDDSTLDIELDYTIPSYRDCSVGTFMFKYLQEVRNISTFTLAVPTCNHEKYLANMGFERSKNQFVKRTK